VVVLGFVGEAQADFLTGSRLSDRILCAEVDWIEDDFLDSLRTWVGVEDGQAHLLWRLVRTIAEQRRVKAHGHFGGHPGLPDARTSRLALLLFAGLEPQPGAVLLVRDTDGDTQRAVGMAQARDDRDWPFRVVIGAAHTKRECWVLAGFDPRDADEEERLKSESTELGFDPRERAEGLTAKHGQDKRSAKRVLGVLTGDDPDRESLCLEADLDQLNARGWGTGLRSFLEEVRDSVVPLFR